MDGRAAFAAGGFLTGAAAVAVACAVTLSNASALADVPGAAADVDVVRVVRASPAASAPAPLAPLASDVAAPVAPPVGPTAEVVPAPEPEDVAAAQSPAQQVSPAQRPASPPAIGLSEQQVVDDAMRTGSWDRLQSWGEQRGWTQERIDRWIAQLQQRFLKDQSQDAQDENLQGENAQREDTPREDAERGVSGDSFADERLMTSGVTSETTVPAPESSEVTGRTGTGAYIGDAAATSHGRPQTPAKNAGSPSVRGESSSHGWKRDQSPQPPRGD